MRKVVVSDWLSEKKKSLSQCRGSRRQREKSQERSRKAVEYDWIV